MQTLHALDAWLRTHLPEAVDALKPGATAEEMGRDMLNESSPDSRIDLDPDAQGRCGQVSWLRAR